MRFPLFYFVNVKSHMIKCKPCKVNVRHFFSLLSTERIKESFNPWCEFTHTYSHTHTHTHSVPLCALSVVASNTFPFLQQQTVGQETAVRGDY